MIDNPSVPKSARWLAIPNELNARCVVMPIDDAHQFDDGLFSHIERTKEHSYQQTEDRLRHRAAHGLKRTILAECLGVVPSALNFELSPTGKPSLIGHQHNLHFNLSHSGDWVALALSEHAPVGVDVEQHKPINSDELLEFVLHPKDSRPTTLAEFYRLWVIKEACVKATGLGLSQPLPSFCVTACHERFTTDQRLVGHYTQLDTCTSLALALDESNFTNS